MQNKEIVCHKMGNNKNLNYMNLWLSQNGNHQLYRKMNGMQRVQRDYHRPVWDFDASQFIKMTDYNMKSAWDLH